MNYYCCATMENMVQNYCDQHDSYTCPDVLLDERRDGSFGIIVKDGGTSSITIVFCPWCGNELPKGEPGRIIDV